MREYWTYIDQVTINTINYNVFLCGQNVQIGNGVQTIKSYELCQAVNI